MNYKESLDYIEDTMKYGSVLGLDNIKELLRRLDNPQNKLSIIHIAGTNGKGSTLAFISTMLKCAGYKVGRYISPTIFEYRERIQINEDYIKEEEFAGILCQVKQVADEMAAEGLGHPTAFEIETTISFLYFLEQKCDIVVLETGLGGILDATNVMDQVLCSVITSISMDHTAFLGNTVEEITKAKAGIIKQNCPVVVYNQDRDILKLIEETAKAHNSAMTVTNDSSVIIIKQDLFIQEFSYRCRGGNVYEHLSISLTGSFQIKNCINALEVIEILKKKGYNISRKAVEIGCEQTKWDGRFQCISQEPLFIIDGAHNPGAAESLKESIEMYFKNQKIIYIVGVLSDKDYNSMITVTMPLADRIFTVAPNSPRKLPAEELAEKIAKVNPNVSAADGYETVIKKALKAAGQNGVIIAFGSLSYLGDLVRAWNNRNE